MKKAMKKSKVQMAKLDATKDPISNALRKEMTREEFEAFAGKCGDKEDWLCKKLDFACKDYLCPRLSRKDSDVKRND